jgi:molecular chaperone DnaJ
MEAQVTIDFEDAIKGGKHRISVQRNGICLSCKGTGKNERGTSVACMACNGKGGRKVANGATHIKVVCTSCSGTGQIYTESCPSCDGSGMSGGMETMTVNIPQGVDHGGRLRIPGKGGRGPDGTSGDLRLRIHITPHRFFKREGKTLHLDLPVSISEAVLGARVEVPTLDGKATLKVPPQTQNGAVLRMKGKGVPDPKGGAPGDMLVRIQVAVPTSADARTKEFYEELKKLEPDPRRGMF